MARDVQLDGDLAYVTSGTPDGGLQVIDVSDPFHPAVVGYFHSDRAANLELVYGHAFVTHTSHRIDVAPLDCSATGAPPVPPGGIVAARSLRLSSNPFRDGCGVTFSLAAPGPTMVSLFDSSGRLVRVLHHGALEDGSHTLG